MPKAETLRAKRIALQQIKAEIISQGEKVCHFNASDIELAAKQVYAMNKELYHYLAREELKL